MKLMRPDHNTVGKESILIPRIGPDPDDNLGYISLHKTEKVYIAVTRVSLSIIPSRLKNERINLNAMVSGWCSKDYTLDN